MTDAEVKRLVDRYNDLLAASSYWIDGGLRLTKYLHDGGMKYRDIYAIMEKAPSEATS